MYTRRNRMNLYLMGSDVNCSASSIHHYKGTALSEGDGLHMVLDGGHRSCFGLIEQQEAPATPPRSHIREPALCMAAMQPHKPARLVCDAGCRALTCVSECVKACAMTDDKRCCREQRLRTMVCSVL